MAVCPETSLAKRVKILELAQTGAGGVGGGSHPPAELTYGGPAFVWNAETQTGNVPIFQVFHFEAVPPTGELIASADKIHLHYAPTGIILSEGVRISSATPGSAGLSVQVFAGGVALFPAPISLSGPTQVIPASGIVAPKRTLLSGEKLEAQVVTDPPGYGNWYGLEVDFMGYVNLNSISPGTPPFNLLAPDISGTTTTGSLLSSLPGSWSGSPTSYLYQWRVNGVPVAGATTPFYTIQVSDAGLPIQLRVTAINANGSTASLSNIIVADP